MIDEKDKEGMEEENLDSVDNSFDLINQQESSDEPIDDITALSSQEGEEDNEETIGDLHDQQMELPEEVSSFVDTGKGEVIDKSKLSHFDVIKALAAKTGTAIRNPKPTCKKCSGRGYIGIDILTNSPFPCTCIYPPKSGEDREKEKALEEKNFAFINRYGRRKMERMLKYSKIRFNRKEFKRNFIKSSPFTISKMERLKAKVELELI
jgi:hypothetical protein